MTNRPHWSYSQLATYLRCPLQYFFQYVLGLPRRTVSSSIVLGAAVHEGLAAYHQSILNGRIVPREEIHAVFRQEWKNRSQSQNIIFQKGKSENQILDQGIELLNLYLGNPPPENIVAVEKQLIAPISNSDGEYLEKPLFAVADLIIRQNDGFQIQDFKTSGRSYSQFEADTSLQATCYFNAAVEVFAEPTEFQFVVLVKTKKPRLQQIDVTRARSDVGRLGDMVQMVDKAVESGIFFPNESPLNCSSCPFRKPCLAWGQPKSNAFADYAVQPGETRC